MAEKRKDSKGRNLRTGESERKDGRYMYRWTVDGQGRSVYAATLGELREKEKQIQKDLDDGIDTLAADSLTINDMYDKWINGKYGLRNTTLAGYKYSYKNYIKDTIGRKKIAKIRYSDLKKYFVQLYRERNLSRSVVNNVNAILSQCFELAEHDGIVRKNQCKVAFFDANKECGKNQREKKNHSLTPQEQNAFFDYINGHPVFDRWYSLFIVLFGTGCRAGEILGLQWTDCDFEEKMINIERTLVYFCLNGKCTYDVHDTKTTAGYRKIPMLTEVEEALQAEKKRQEEMEIEQPTICGYSNFVFLSSNGKPQTTAGINHVIDRILKYYYDEEIEKAAKEKRRPFLIRHFSCHSARHTFASRICENSSNLKAIQEIMGHANIKTTLNIYADATIEGKRKSMDSLEGKIFNL